VTIGGLRCIGKESNRLEEVEQGFSTLDAIRRLSRPAARRVGRRFFSRSSGSSTRSSERFERRA
jgi:hypothetical protein